MKILTTTALCGAALFFAVSANATVITSLDGSQEWVAESASGGASELKDLTGAGGTLEADQPLPTGAVHQTTPEGDNSAFSIVKREADYGTVRDLFDAEIGFSYSYYKGSGASNVSAAPALKLGFDNGNGGIGQLIYEPYWQPVGAVNTPTADEWIDVAIGYDQGLFWTTGMYGQPNSFGGPPLRTLSDWRSQFDEAFLDADLLFVGLGIGTYNQGQRNYFDNVQVSGTNADGSWDFEAPAEVPVPASLPLLLASLGGLALARRKRA